MRDACCPCPARLRTQHWSRFKSLYPVRPLGPGRGSGGASHQGSEGLMMLASRPPFPRSPHLRRPPGTLRTQAHQGDFICVECGKSFHQPSHLRAHMRAHTGTPADPGSWDAASFPGSGPGWGWGVQGHAPNSPSSPCA